MPGTTQPSPFAGALGQAWAPDLLHQKLDASVALHVIGRPSGSIVQHGAVLVRADVGILHAAALIVPRAHVRVGRHLRQLVRQRGHEAIHAEVAVGALLPTLGEGRGDAVLRALQVEEGWRGGGGSEIIRWRYGH